MARRTKVLVGVGAAMVVLGAGAYQASSTAGLAIPGPYLAAYRLAAERTEPPVPWEILAAVGEVATDHGRHPGPGPGIGPLLLTPSVDAPPGDDLADITDAAEALARAAGRIEEPTWLGLGLTGAVATAPLDDPAAIRFWSAVLPQLPVAIDPSPVPTSGDPLTGFDTAVLTALGDPATPADLAGLAAWASGEGSSASYNPFDTTQPEPGSRPFNANGGDPVQDYPDEPTGVAATVATLEPGGRPAPAYAPILAALAQGTSATAIDTAVAASPWGTRHFPDPAFTASANFPLSPGSTSSSSSPSSAASSVLAVAQRYAGLPPTASAPTPATFMAGGAVGGAAAVAVTTALAQLGKPYQLGATGPAAFDCSGLVQVAWRAAGVALPRTTYQQVGVGQPVPVDDPAAFEPGDLLFIMGADPEGGLPGHVGMVVGPGQVIDAPYTDAVVRITPLSTWTGQLVAVRRVAG